MPKEVNTISIMVYTSSTSRLQYGTDTIEVDPDFQEVPASKNQSFGLARIIHFNGTKPCEILSNVTFLLLTIGLLICMAMIMVMCANPKAFGFEVDDRYLRIINDEATESDVSFFEKSLFSAE